MTAIALTIAGSDPSGGAGIQADLKTFAAQGVYGASVITALTAQNTTGVFGIHGVPADFVRAQAEAVFEDLAVGAVKIGMLGDPEAIVAIADILQKQRPLPIVLDPVMVAANGDPLLQDDAVAALRKHLLLLATVVTPNVYEAALLLDRPVAEDAKELQAQAEALLTFSPGAVLLKGGRLQGEEEALDILAAADGTRILRAPRIPVDRPHGTGCTLSSAIAAQLALGSSLFDATQSAKSYVTAALKRAAAEKIGKGAQPLLH